MERFIKALLGYSVRYDQPRLWFTKGETLSEFLRLPAKSAAHLIDTRSCWQTRRVVNIDGNRRQCGLCAACLLRRMSFHRAGVQEPPETYVVSDLSRSDLRDALKNISDKADRSLMMEYGAVATRHMQALADMKGLSRSALHMHALEIARATGISESETLEKLNRLLEAHSDEWRVFLAAQGQQSFLKSWMEDRRHG